MKFSANTVYNRERLLGFTFFMASRKIFLWILMFLCTAIVGTFFTLSLLAGEFNVLILIYLCIIVILDITYIIGYFVLPRFNVKKAPSLDMTLNFEFKDDVFKITAIGKNGEENSELKYAVLTKVLKSKKDIYLFTTSRQAFIVDKSGFIDGNHEEFIQFINSKIAK